MLRKASVFAGLVAVAALPTMAIAQNAPAPVESPPPVAQPVPQAAPPVAPKPAPAPPAKPKKKGPVDSLKPGQYIWEQRAYKATNLRIVAVLDIQRIYIFDGDTLVAFSTMSTGKKGHPTPTGIFKILQKNVDHKSNLYSNAPMPYMQRLTWDGIALHAGHIPGYPASHGCLRLPLAFAKALYSVTAMDQTVIVLPDLSTPAPKEEPKPEPVPEPKPEPKIKPEPVATDPMPAEPAPPQR